MIHYKVCYVNRSSEEFCFFDNKDKMFAWLSNKTQEPIRCFSDIIEWNRKQFKGIAHTKGYIKISKIKNTCDYYDNRKEYINAIEICNTLKYQSHKINNAKRKLWVLAAFERVYEFANFISIERPEVWLGEI